MEIKGKKQFMAISSAAASHECECTVVLAVPGITSTTWPTKYLNNALTRAMAISIFDFGFGLRIVSYSSTQPV